jgi:2'-5' RNA ligase
MRLFIAINFDEDLKNKIESAIEALRGNAVKGNFTKHENLHLTLVFIGNSNRLEDIRQAMEIVDVEAFKLSVKGFGRFRRTSGDIYWLGIEKSSALQNIYNQLYTALTSRGFQVEDREYTPHLTLVREAILDKNFDIKSFEKNIPQMSMKVKGIDLMKSERIRGSLVYTSIYEKKLGE